MRYLSVVASGVVVGMALMSSCTCHRQVTQEQPPTGFAEHKPGFHTTPQVQAKAATVTPMHAPEQVAQAPTPSVPPPPLPDDFPKEVPVFKDATVSQVQSLANDAHNVIFNTAAPVSEVSQFYEDKLTQQGWKITQQFTREKHAFASFQKGDMIANVTVAEDVKNPGHQIIAIMYEQRKPLDFDEF